MRGVLPIALTMLVAALPAAAQDPARLQRPIAIGDGGALPADATLGQVIVSSYDWLERKHGDALAGLSDSALCRSGSAPILSAVAKARAAKLTDSARDALGAGDATALTALAIDSIGELDGVDPERIRADEAIGPGVYHAAIAAIRTAIERCRFY